MLRIRLIRIGKKNAPAFRVVLTEKTSPPQGKFLEVLGSYNPRLKEVNLKKERILYWLSQGAQASDTVHNLLVGQKIIEGPKIKKKIKSKTKSETSEAATEEKKEEPAQKTDKPEEPKELKSKDEPKPKDEKKEEKTDKPVVKEEKKEKEKPQEIKKPKTEEKT